MRWRVGKGDILGWKLSNGDHAGKFGQVIHSRDLMYRACNILYLYKVKSECVIEGKFQKNLVYELKCSL